MGSRWFDLPSASHLPDTEKQDIRALRLATVLDPKNFLRGEAKKDIKLKAKLPDYLQVGHLLPTDHPASTAAPFRPRKQQSFLQSIVDDARARSYARRKTAELEATRSSGGRKHWRSRMAARRSVSMAEGSSSGRRGRKRKRG